MIRTITRQQLIEEHLSKLSPEERTRRLASFARRVKRINAEGKKGSEQLSKLKPISFRQARRPERVPVEAIIDTELPNYDNGNIALEAGRLYGVIPRGSLGKMPKRAPGIPPFKTIRKALESVR
jgi:hypothetical protein